MGFGWEMLKCGDIEVDTKVVFFDVRTSPRLELYFADLDVQMSVEVYTRGTLELSFEDETYFKGGRM